MADMYNPLWLLLKPRLSTRDGRCMLWADIGCGAHFVAKRFQYAFGEGELEKDRARVRLRGKALTRALSLFGAPEVLQEAYRELRAMAGVHGLSAQRERVRLATRCFQVWEDELKPFDDYLGGR